MTSKKEIKTIAQAKKLLGKKIEAKPGSNKSEFNNIITESLMATYERLSEEEQSTLNDIAEKMSHEVKGQFGFLSALEVMTVLTYFEEFES